MLKGKGIISKLQKKVLNSLRDIPDSSYRKYGKKAPGFSRGDEFDIKKVGAKHLWFDLLLYAAELVEERVLGIGV